MMIKRYLFVILLLAHILYATALPQSIKYSDFISKLVLYDAHEPDGTESKFLYFFEKKRGAMFSFRKDSDKISKIEMKNYTFVVYDDEFLGAGMLFDNNGTMKKSFLLRYRDGNVNYHDYKEYEITVVNDSLKIDIKHIHEDTQWVVYGSRGYMNAYLESQSFSIDKNGILSRDKKESYEYYDKELNQLYKKLLSKIPKDKKISLITSQKAWLKYKLSYCKSNIFDVDFMADDARCQLSITKQRVEELQKLEIFLDDYNEAHNKSK